jgi:hypothetical protein
MYFVVDRGPRDRLCPRSGTPRSMLSVQGQRTGRAESSSRYSDTGERASERASERWTSKKRSGQGEKRNRVPSWPGSLQPPVQSASSLRATGLPRECSRSHAAGKSLVRERAETSANEEHRGREESDLACCDARHPGSSGVSGAGIWTVRVRRFAECDVFGFLLRRLFRRHRDLSLHRDLPSEKDVL